MVIWGVDPGLSGALAVLVDGQLADVFDMPTISEKARAKTRTRIDVGELARTMRLRHRPDGVVIEAVTASPGAGVGSMFRFGQGLGQVQGIVAALGLRSVMVPPAQWKGAMRLRGGDKGLSREAARKVWPERERWFARAKDDGRAEAALLALYAQRARLFEGAAQGVRLS